MINILFQNKSHVTISDHNLEISILHKDSKNDKISNLNRYSKIHNLIMSRPTEVFDIISTYFYMKYKLRRPSHKNQMYVFLSYVPFRYSTHSIKIPQETRRFVSIKEIIEQKKC